jgi:hypothetical protein
MSQTVWKKALRCISVTQWKWEFVIIEMTADTPLVCYDLQRKKHRTKEVTVVGIHLDRRHIGAAARAAATAVKRHVSTSDICIENWDCSKSLEWNCSKYNYTGLSDGDVVSWFDHTKWNIGAKVVAHGWDDSSEEMCVPGIHCFLTREDAELYIFW